MYGNAFVNVLLECRAAYVTGADGLGLEEGVGKVEGLGEEDVVFREDVWPGGHCGEVVVLDGPGEAIDGLDDLGGLELERLELGCGERGGGEGGEGSWL